MSKKLNIKANMKKATSSTDLETMLWGGAGALSYTLLPSLFGKISPNLGTGWLGLGIASVGTWLLGAMFDKPAIRYGGFFGLVTHLVYSKGEGMLSDIGLPPFRIGGRLTAAPINTQATLPEGQTPVSGLSSFLPGANVLNSPQGYAYHTRSAEQGDMGKYLPSSEIAEINQSANEALYPALNGLGKYLTNEEIAQLSQKATESEYVPEPLSGDPTRSMLKRGVSPRSRNYRYAN